MQNERWFVVSYCDARNAFYCDIVVVPTAEGAKAQIWERRPYIDAVMDDPLAMKDITDILDAMTYKADNDLRAVFIRHTAQDQE